MRRSLTATAAAVLLAAAAPAGCGGDADAGGPPRAIDYVRDSGGIANRHLHLRVTAGGRATVSGDEVEECADQPLSTMRRERLQRALRAARLAETRSQTEDFSEAPSREFRSGGRLVRFTGFEPLPERVERLADELEAVARTACPR